MLPHFDLANTAAYRAWRERKLAAYPESAQELVVEVRDPLDLSAAERDALLARCGRANMAIYACTRPPQDAKEALRALSAQLGLHTLDANYLADDDGISPITVASGGVRGEFIPYTDRPIRWHTDGYYNPPERTIRAMVLHCVHQAERGGENRLLDHELAYIALRDLDPAFVAALMQPDAMTIPARASEGEVARGDQCGPVFSFDGAGRLHMRYTARTRSIVWKQDAGVLGAAQALAAILDSHPRVLQVRLEPGMGIVCNNVLHDRAAFSDSAARRRLVLRARYYEAITAVDTRSPHAAVTA
ncbi:MAG: TauD/TfdA family dioxygenase [Burkholderiaceae bacterium]|nr:TauD/TfdA family dioxygenase [Burkholderiaceae bacterium]